MEDESKRNLILIGIFAAAMAFTEAMIVYYLRKLYYTGDALFPLNISIPLQVISLEWIREISTIIMLIVIALLVARKFKDRFAYFIYAFAVWDIFYYVWLKVILDWPKHLMDWDILFLIPIVWASPWIAPVICSLIMIIIALVIIKFPKTEIKLEEWILLVVSAIVFFASFVWDYARLWSTAKSSQLDLMQAISTYVPTGYNWLLFVMGIILSSIAILSFLRRARRHLSL